MGEQGFPAQGKIAVLGSGVIGACCAVELVRAGFDVELVDRSEPGDSTAAHNGGLLCYSHIDPMVDGSALKQLPFQLMRRDGPVVVAKGQMRKLAPWMKFALKSSTSSKVSDTMDALAGLHRISPELTQDLFHRAGIDQLYRPVGVVYAYTTSKAWESAAPKWERKNDFSVKWDIVSGRDIGNLDPSISRNSYTAVLAKEDAMVSDTREVVESLATLAANTGASVRRTEVLGVRSLPAGGVEVSYGDGRDGDYDGCVVAMGMWSARVAAGLGDPVLLAAQRGYNMTVGGSSDADARYPCVYEDMGIVVTPLAMGLRVGGLVEFDELDNPPSQRVRDALRKKVRELFPALKADDDHVIEWMGQRPSTPDSLPVIGHSRKAPGVIYAFGHGHLGLTQSAATAACVAAMARGESTPCPVEPFGIGRFA